MITYTKEYIKTIFTQHTEWLSGKGGKCAYLSGAYLSGADLSGANLSGANLSHADLSGANLSGADLSGAKKDDQTKFPHFQICAGSLIVWKKVQGRLVTLLIPGEARRTASLVGRKCRAEYAIVTWIEEGESVTSGGYFNRVRTVYNIGEIVRPDSYDDNPMMECSHGIHFFLTEIEAKEWNQ
jgi:hypothetical protein